MKINLLGLAMAVLLCGCSMTYGTRPEDIQPRAKILPTPIVKPDYTPGSLWPGENSRNMLFTDNKARYVNDIVTIIIDESPSGQNKASTNTSKNSESKSHRRPESPYRSRLFGTLCFGWGQDILTLLAHSRKTISIDPVVSSV